MIGQIMFDLQALVEPAFLAEPPVVQVDFTVASLTLAEPSQRKIRGKLEIWTVILGQAGDYEYHNHLDI